jgi:hypothetical protein
MKQLAEVRPLLADEYLESYVSWREACEDVRAAYGRWAERGRGRGKLEFAAYQAALDQEEHAAGIYREWTDRVTAEAA